jgi:hypothetical protein
MARKLKILIHSYKAYFLAFVVEIEIDSTIGA